MGKLYCVKFGQTMQEIFLNDCAERDYKYNQAMFVLPSLLLIEKVKERAFVQVGTFDGFVKSILQLNNVRINNFSHSSQEIIISGLLDGLQSSANLNFFSGFSNSSGLKKALVAFFAELSKAGIEADSFVQVLSVFAEKEGLRAKDKEIATIYLAYKNFLQQSNLFDVQSVYLKAIDVLQCDAVIFPWQKVYISEFYRFDALQLEIIKHISRMCKVDISLVYQDGDEEVYQATKKTYEDVVGCGFNKKFMDIKEEKSSSLTKLCDKLFKYEIKKIKVGNAVKVKIFANRRQEMQELVANIKKRILQDNSSTKDIVVIVRNIAFYPGLRREFLLAGVPVALPDALKLFIQPLTKIVLAFLQIVDGDVRKGLDNMFSVFVIKECLQIDVDKVKEIIAKKYFVTLDDARELFAKEFSEDEAMYKAIDSLFISLESCPKYAVVDVFSQQIADFLKKLDIVNCLGSLYRKNVIKQEELKLLAKTYQELLVVLANVSFDYEVAGEQKKEMFVSVYENILENYLKEHVFVEEKGDENGVKVFLASEVSGLSYKHVYIIGLKEGEFPQLESENWLYNDEERKKLSALGFLTDTSKIMSQDKLFFACSVATASESLWLSASVADGETVSSYVEEVVAICSDLLVEKRFAKDILPDVVDIVSKDILACYFVKQDMSDLFSQSWLNDYLGIDFIVRGGIEQPQRLGCYNGSLASDEVKDMIKKQFNMIFHPSSLESYAFCPFKFLVEYVWRLRDWQVANEFLRADFRGNFYHDCLRRFLSMFLEKPLFKESVAFLQEKMKNIFDNTLSEYLDSGKLNKTYLTEQELISMYNYLQSWLKSEIDYQKSNSVLFTPSKLEWRFGHLANSSEKERLILHTKEGEVELKGQIDRIDRSSEDFFVTDYKLRTTPRKIDIDKGIDLQIPIYLLAVEKFFGTPIGGNYFSVENSKRDGGFWLNSSQDKVGFTGRISTKQKNMPDDWQEYKRFFIEKIAGIVEGICKGEFSPNPIYQCPDYCVGKKVCRYVSTVGIGEIDE